MQMRCVVGLRLIEVMLMRMDEGAGKSSVSHGFRAGVSGVAIEHEILKALLSTQYTYYICQYNNLKYCTGLGQSHERRVNAMTDDRRAW